MAKSRWTLAAVCLATFMLLLDITIVQVALPSIGRDFHQQLSGLQWILDCYVLPLAALIVTFGTIADRIGRRRVFLAGLVTFTAASLACGIAPTVLGLDVARAVQGLGGAGMFATTLALIGQEFSGAARARAVVIWGSTVGAAVAMGPLVGGLLADTIGWRWIFLVNLPVGIAAVALTLRHVGDGRVPRPRRVDVAGAVTLTAGLALVTAGLLRGSATNWATSGPVVALAAGVLVLLGWCVLQRRPQAMVDRTLFRNRGFVGVTVATLCLGAGMFAMLLYLTIYLQDALGASPLRGGVELLPFAVPVFVVPLVARRLAVPMVSGRTLATALAAVTCGLALLLLGGATSSWTSLLPGLVVAGVGVGLANPSIAAIALAAVEPARAGLASGVSNACRIAGITIGVAGLGAVQRQVLVSAIAAGPHRGTLVDLIASGQLRAAAHLSSAGAVNAAYTHGLHVTFVVGALALAVGTVAAVALIPRMKVVTEQAPLPSAVPAAVLS
jgi:EmrB/QacA subfamily drug resistance transporter